MVRGELMPKVFKGSLIINLILCSFKAVSNSYKASRFKIFADKCGVALRASLVYGIIRRYFYKPAYFEYSLTYGFIMWLVRVFDVPVGAIGRFFANLTGASNFIDSANKLAAASVKDKLAAAAVIGIFISLGFALGTVIKGGAVFELIPSAVIFAAALVLLAVSGLAKYAKSSVVYKLINWFVG